MKVRDRGLIKAVRTGEAGHGFGVEASEARSPAQRSAQAAKSINNPITNSSGQERDGVKLAGRAGAALTGITERVAFFKHTVGLAGTPVPPRPAPPPNRARSKRSDRPLSRRGRIEKTALIQGLRPKDQICALSHIEQ